MRVASKYRPAIRAAKAIKRQKNKRRAVSAWAKAVREALRG